MVGFFENIVKQQGVRMNCLLIKLIETLLSVTRILRVIYKRMLD